MNMLFRPRTLTRTLRQYRWYTVPASENDLRVHLTTEIKNALKSKNMSMATTLRTILSEVQAADKIHKNGLVGTSTIRAVIGKGIVRRNDAASKYIKANRPDLAAKEHQEVQILEKLLPPAISDSEVEATLRQIIDTLPQTGKAPLLGQIFKEFYAKFDKSLVRPDVVKRMAQQILAPVSAKNSL